MSLARALINHPKLVLADEPTGNLDEANEQIVLELLNELHRAGHVPFLLRDALAARSAAWPTAGLNWRTAHLMQIVANVTQSFSPAERAAIRYPGGAHADSSGPSQKTSRRDGARLEWRRASILLGRTEHRSHYDFVYLREQCPCAMCDDERAKKRKTQ